MSAVEFTEEQIAERHAQALTPSDTARGLAIRIARAHGVRSEDVLGPSRHPHLVAARRDLYAALRAKGWSYPAIGAFVGGRDHTTVMYALASDEKRAAKRLARKIGA